MNRAYFIERLETNLANAQAEYARIEQIVLAARERGVDTSRVVPPSAQSSDMTLRKAEGRVEHAQKALDKYLERGAQ